MVARSLTRDGALVSGWLPLRDDGALKGDGCTKPHGSLSHLVRRVEHSYFMVRSCAVDTLKSLGALMGSGMHSLVMFRSRFLDESLSCFGALRCSGSTLSVRCSPALWLNSKIVVLSQTLVTLHRIGTLRYDGCTPGEWFSTLSG